jgi:hypothetical protein
MANPDFGKDDIKLAADKLLKTLYDESGGNEWNYYDLDALINKVEGMTSEYLKNIPLRQNVLQSLIAEGFVDYKHGPKATIGITYKGKKYLDKVPTFSEKIIDG